MKKTLLTLLLVFIPIITFAQTCTISSSLTINTDAQWQQYTSCPVIYVQGEGTVLSLLPTSNNLNMANSATIFVVRDKAKVLIDKNSTLTFPAGSSIVIQSGGVIEATGNGNASTLIKVGNESVAKGDNEIKVMNDNNGYFGGTAYNVTGGGSYCSGGTGKSIGLSNSQTGVSYQLQRDDNNVGTPIAGTNGSAIDFGNQTVAGTYKVLASLSIGGQTKEMTGTATITINQSPTISTQPSSSTICENSNTTFSITASGSSLNYKWQVSTNGGATFTDLSNTGIYTDVTTPTVKISPATSGMNSYQYRCVVVSGPCSVTSNAATLTVNKPSIAPTSITGTTPICEGTSTTLTSVGGTLGTGANYQWGTGATPGTSPLTGQTSSTLTVSPVSSTTYWVRIVNTTSPCISTTSGVTITVTVNPLPTVFNVTGGGTYCAGGSGVAVGLSNSQSGVNYQLQIEGANTGSPVVGTGSSISFGNQTTAGTYTVVAKNTTTSCQQAMTGSATITIIPTNTATLTSAASTETQTVCINTAITPISYNTTGATGATFTGLPAGVSGSWISNTATISGTPTTTTGSPFSYTMTLTGGCGTVTKTGTITVNPNLTASVSISASSTTICSGTSVTFTATPTNGGSAPTYQWKLNGVNVGSNSSTYSNATLVNGDFVTCVMTSNANCATGTPATSNTVTMTVNPTVTASVSIAASSTTICSGTSVTFTATPTNGGSTPIYQWKLNGVNVGSNSTTYSNATLTDGNLVTCVMTSNATCATGSPATSNTVTMRVNPNLTASVSIAASSTAICSGTSVTFTATPTNGGSAPTYQWKLNGINVGSNSNTYSNATLTSGDLVTCEMNSNATCATGNPATSNTVTMTVNPNNTVTTVSPVGACANVALANINHTTTGATGIGTATGLPAGVTAVFGSNTITLSGTPTVSGIFSYSIPLTGGCGSVSAIGTITVNDKPTITSIAALTLSSGESLNPPTPTVTPNGSTITISGWEIETSVGSGSFIELPTPYLVVYADNGKKLRYYSTNDCGTTYSNQVIITVNNNKIWTGAIDSDWFESKNWSPEGVPGLQNDIIIPSCTNSPVIDIANSRVTTKTDPAINTLTISSGTLKVVSTLTVIDILKVNSGATLTLDNNASLIQINDVQNVNNGNISIQRNSAPLLFNDYTYWSSPCTGQTLRDFSPNSNPKYFLTYSNKWTYVSSTNNFTKGLGYAILAPLNASPSTPAPMPFTFKGNPNNGSFTIASDWVDATSSKLIGNPYPSALDVNKFITANLATISEIYFWTHNTTLVGASGYTTNDYAMITLAGATPVASTGGHGNTNIPQNYIASGQGFVVKTISSSPIRFTNAMRAGGTDTNNKNFYRNINNSTSKELERNRIWLNLTNKDDMRYNQILVGYVENATDNYDTGFDGVDISNRATALYSLIGNDAYAIQAKALPFSEADIVPLGYKSETAGTSKISIETVDGLFTNGPEIFIEDKLLNIMHNLKTSAYTFTTEAGTFDNRFVLRYNDKKGAGNILEETSNIIVTSKNHELRIESETEPMEKIFVYDILGRQIYQNTKVDSTRTSIFDLGANQILIVKVVLNNGKSILKKVVF